jgi:hypothetical protein
MFHLCPFVFSLQLPSAIFSFQRQPFSSDLRFRVNALISLNALLPHITPLRPSPLTGLNQGIHQLHHTSWRTCRISDVPLISNMQGRGQGKVPAS